MHASYRASVKLSVESLRWKNTCTIVNVTSGRVIRSPGDPQSPTSFNVPTGDRHSEVAPNLESGRLRIDACRTTSERDIIQYKIQDFCFPVDFSRYLSLYLCLQMTWDGVGGLPWLDPQPECGFPSTLILSFGSY